MRDHNRPSPRRKHPPLVNVKLATVALSPWCCPSVWQRKTPGVCYASHCHTMVAVDLPAVPVWQGGPGRYCPTYSGLARGRHDEGCVGASHEGGRFRGGQCPPQGRTPCASDLAKQ